MRREEQLRQLRGQVLNSVVEIVVESAGIPLLQEEQLMEVATRRSNMRVAPHHAAQYQIVCTTA